MLYYMVISTVFSAFLRIYSFGKCQVVLTITAESAISSNLSVVVLRASHLMQSRFTVTCVHNQRAGTRMRCTNVPQMPLVRKYSTNDGSSWFIHKHIICQWTRKYYPATISSSFFYTCIVGVRIISVRTDSLQPHFNATVLIGYS